MVNMTESSAAVHPADDVMYVQVGRDFVRQYYELMSIHPDHLYRFYGEKSSFLHDDPDRWDPVTGTSSIIGQDVCYYIGFGSLGVVVKCNVGKDIRMHLDKMNLFRCQTKLHQVDVQSGLEQTVLIQVVGDLAVDGQKSRKFMQSFVLAPHGPKRYYVHNDIFRYQDVAFPDSYAPDSTDDGVAEGERTEAERHEVVPTSPAQAQPATYTSGSLGMGAAIPHRGAAMASGVHQHQEPPSPRMSESESSVPGGPRSSTMLQPESDGARVAPPPPHTALPPRGGGAAQQHSSQQQQPPHASAGQHVGANALASSTNGTAFVGVVAATANGTVSGPGGDPRLDDSNVLGADGVDGCVDSLEPEADQHFGGTTSPETADDARGDAATSPIQTQVPAGPQVTSTRTSWAATAAASIPAGRRSHYDSGSTPVIHNEQSEIGASSDHLDSMVSPPPADQRGEDGTQRRSGGFQQRQPGGANVKASVNQLFVGSLPLTCQDENMVRDLFSAYGEVTDVRMINKSKVPCAFVTFSSNDSAARALADKDNIRMAGCAINIQEKKPQGTFTGPGNPMHRGGMRGGGMQGNTRGGGGGFRGGGFEGAGGRGGQGGFGGRGGGGNQGGMSGAQDFNRGGVRGDGFSPVRGGSQPRRQGGSTEREGGGGQRGGYSRGGGGNFNKDFRGGGGGSSNRGGGGGRGFGGGNPPRGGGGGSRGGAQQQQQRDAAQATR